MFQSSDPNFHQLMKGNLCFRTSKMEVHHNKLEDGGTPMSSSIVKQILHYYGLSAGQHTGYCDKSDFFKLNRKLWESKRLHSKTGQRLSQNDYKNVC